MKNILILHDKNSVINQYLFKQILKMYKNVLTLSKSEGII